MRRWFATHPPGWREVVTVLVFILALLMTLLYVLQRRDTLNERREAKEAESSRAALAQELNRLGALVGTLQKCILDTGEPSEECRAAAAAPVPEVRVEGSGPLEVVVPERETRVVRVTPEPTPRPTARPTRPPPRASSRPTPMCVVAPVCLP